jgi:hypothetical protein
MMLLRLVIEIAGLAPDAGGAVNVFAAGTLGVFAVVLLLFEVFDKDFTVVSVAISVVREIDTFFLSFRVILVSGCAVIARISCWASEKWLVGYSMLPPCSLSSQRNSAVPAASKTRPFIVE